MVEGGVNPLRKPTEVTRTPPAMGWDRKPQRVRPTNLHAVRATAVPSTRPLVLSRKWERTALARPAQGITMGNGILLPPCNPRKTCYNDEIHRAKGCSIIMRCSCKECGVYMVQAESDHLGCVCPDCGYRCNDCLGTDTVVSRDSLRALAFDPRFQPENLARSFQREEDDQDDAY